MSDTYELIGWPAGGGDSELLEESPERMSLADAVGRYAGGFIALEVHRVAGSQRAGIDERHRTIVAAWCKDWADDVAASKARAGR